MIVIVIIMAIHGEINQFVREFKIIISLGNNKFFPFVCFVICNSNIHYVIIDEH